MRTIPLDQEKEINLCFYFLFCGLQEYDISMSTIFLGLRSIIIMFPKLGWKAVPTIAVRFGPLTILGLILGPIVSKTFHFSSPWTKCFQHPANFNHTPNIIMLKIAKCPLPGKATKPKSNFFFYLSCFILDNNI